MGGSFWLADVFKAGRMPDVKDSNLRKRLDLQVSSPGTCQHIAFIPFQIDKSFFFKRAVHNTQGVGPIL